MFKWLKQRRINRLLVARAGCLGCIHAWGDKSVCGYEYMELARISEQLRQLGYVPITDKIRTSAFPPIESDADIEALVSQIASAIKQGDDPLMAEIRDHLLDYGVNVKRSIEGGLEWARVGGKERDNA